MEKRENHKDISSGKFFDEMFDYHGIEFDFFNSDLNEVFPTIEPLKNEKKYLDSQEREEYSCEYQRLVLDGAKKLEKPMGMDIKLITSIASLGLMKALTHFDKNSDIDFECFATNLINTEIFRFYRKNHLHTEFCHPAKTIKNYKESTEKKTSNCFR